MKSELEKETNIKLENHYRTELFSHMRKTRNRYISRSARGIGRKVFEDQKSVLILTQIHMHALEELMQSKPDKADKLGKAFFTRSGSFLSEAIGVVESKTNQKTASLVAENRTIKERLNEESDRCKQLAAHAECLEKDSKLRVRQFILAQEEDRKQISRDLHDQIAQTLAGINIRLAMIRKMAAQDTQDLRRKIAQTQHLVEKSVKIVHSFARKLRPAMLDDLGLISSLRALFKDSSELKKLEIRFSSYPEVETLSNQYRTVLYRVIQESLTNVVRHSRAKIVDITITEDSDVLHLEVADNGKSFPVDQTLSSGRGKCLGLLGMRERVEMIGGHFSITSLKGRGTTISADIPLLV